MTHRMILILVLIFVHSLLTIVVFVCFTVSALLAERRAFLFLGGFLSSMLCVLLVLNVIVWLTGNDALDNLTLVCTNINIHCGDSILD